jgi:hypothetical protein
MNKLLIHEEPLQVLPSLAAKIGLNEAIMLQQIHYWLRKSKNIRDGKPWIYNTYAEWEKQFPWWSNRTIKRIVDNLRAAGLIETTSKYNKLNIDQTLWYTINYGKLDMGELTESPAVPESDKMAQSDSATSAESDKMSLPKVPTCHNGGDKMAQSAPVAESDKLALPLPRDIQENTTRENSACAQPEAPQPATPSPLPLSAHSQPAAGGLEKLLNAARENANGNYGKRQAQTHIDGLKKKLNTFGIDQAQFTAMVDSHLSIKGTKDLADGDSEAADRALRKAQQFVVDLCGIGQRFWTADGVNLVWDSWKKNDWRSDPSEQQLLEHASQMVAGKVGKGNKGGATSSANGNGKPAGVYVGVAENLK